MSKFNAVKHSESLFYTLLRHVSKYFDHLHANNKKVSAETLIKCSFFGRDSPQWARVSLFTRFLDHTQRRTTLCRTPLYERSARRRDLHLTTHNAHNVQTIHDPAGFEPTISAGERPKTYALDYAANGTGALI